MKLSKFGIITLLLLTTFFREIVFSAVVPIWQTPDEQAHFAQVAYFSEFNKMPGQGFDLNKEIYESENILGTLRDEHGNNKFTFHPDYKIDYTDSQTGKYENAVNSLPFSYRTEMVKYEAANYPPLYYWISALFYTLFYNSGLIIRIFSVRFVSILMSLGTVYIAWLIGKKLFPKNSLSQIVLATMVSFQPMFSFVSSGVNSDNLFNFTFALIIYSGILFITNGFTKKTIIFSLISLILAYLTKPQFILGIPIIFTGIILAFILSNKFSNKTKILTTFFVAISGVFIFILITFTDFYKILEKIYNQSFYPGNPKIKINIFSFFKETIRHSIAEVIPWYWGVFDWLGVTYPRVIHRIINWLMIGSGLGIVINFYRIFKKRTKEDYLFLYILISALVYFLGITYYNYLFTISHGFPFGIQGRYYFPTLISQMIILLIGLTAIVPGKFLRFKNLYTKILGILMIVLNFYALWTIARTYYDFSNLNIFITQASQYKPVIFKGYFLEFWFILYLLSILIFLYKYLNFSFKSVGKKY